MSTFYAYCRVADDIVDEPGPSEAEKRQQLLHLRSEIKSCYEGTPSTELGFELQEIIREYLIPPQPFFDLLDGVEMDLVKRRYATFEELSLYCYRVASAVGLVSIEIFGFSHPQSKEYAVALGMAFQLTNILRDVQHDLEKYDRIYLPQTELNAFGVTETDLRSGEISPAKARLFRLQHFRATHYFHKASRLLPPVDRPGFIAAELMTEVYYRLLNKIQKRDFNILSTPVRLNKLQKMWAVGVASKKGAAINRHPRPKPKHIAVWGAGFAGISAATHLVRAGHTVDLYESRSYLGGRAHSFTDVKTGLTFDNGQHIFMGCYHSCLELFDMLGITDKLALRDTMEVPFLSPGGRMERLKSSNLPAPFHLAGALLNYGELSWKDRFAIARLGLALRLGQKPAARQTVTEWFKQHGQTPNSIRSLWEPFCVAALNEPCQHASALLLYETLRRSLFGTKADAAIYISRVGLSELFQPELQLFLNATGSRLKLNEGIRSVQWDGTRISSFESSSQANIQADAYVSALPWMTLKTLLPEEEKLTRDLASIGSSPIISLHIICDCPITDEPFVGLLDSQLHWIFDRSAHLPESERQNFMYALVISAATPVMEMKQDEFVRFMWSEVNRFFPHTRSGQILRHIVYKSKDATFAARPETEAHRPGPRSPWKNLFLTGDWTRTGLPGTLEGAVWSGQEVVNAIDQAGMD
ncbi:MAG: squalene/phytoene synthase family protein [Blastochloris sp.]|nr:squalene/phytoene synthase family protein [Blastochloris sp.]